jgi:hypothetical protein
MMAACEICAIIGLRPVKLLHRLNWHLLHWAATGSRRHPLDRQEGTEGQR